MAARAILTEQLVYSSFRVQRIEWSNTGSNSGQSHADLWDCFETNGAVETGTTGGQLRKMNVSVLSQDIGESIQIVCKPGHGYGLWAVGSYLEPIEDGLLRFTGDIVWHP